MCSELFECNTFTVYSLNPQVEGFLADLSPQNWVKFDSVVELFTRLLLTGAPAVDRIEKVKGASGKIYELKITAPGSKGPQLRVLCLVKGRAILCLRGIDKRQSRLRRQDIEAADKAATDYLRVEDEPKGKSRKRKKCPP